MEGLQVAVYNKALESIIKNTKDIEQRGDINPILDNLLLTQISNIVYPVSTQEDIVNEIMNESLSIKECYGDKGFSNCMNLSIKGSIRTYSYKKNILKRVWTYL